MQLFDEPVRFRYQKDKALEIFGEFLCSCIKMFGETLIGIEL